MTLDFVYAVQAEWLKRRRSLALWLVVVGALFTPAIVIVARLVRRRELPALYAMDEFWQRLWHSSWESMAMFFLPMAVVFATGLIAQIEVKNNAWKQVHAQPLALAAIYLAKLVVILVLIVQFVALFNVGIYASAVVPYLLVGGLPYPDALPAGTFLAKDLWYLLDCLPIVAAQYLLSLRYRNFMVPVGVGFMTWVASLAALSWKYGALLPYTYCMLEYLKDDPSKKAAIPPVDIHVMAAAYFVLFLVLGYAMFATKADKG